MNLPNDHRLELSLSRLLSAGTMLSGLIMLVGVATMLWRSPAAPRPHYEQFIPAPEQGKSLSAIAHSLLSLDPHAIMLTGVLLLILTPVARVLFTLFAFALKRDWLYVAMTSIVLGVLAYGLLGGKVH